MQQTVLKEHNLDPAIASNLASNSASKNLENFKPHADPTPATQNLIPTLSTLNLNADNLEPTDHIELTEPIQEEERAMSLD